MAGSREARKIPLNWEHRLMLGMAPDYDGLPVIHKVEVFEYALDATSGEDLHKVRPRARAKGKCKRARLRESIQASASVGQLRGAAGANPRGPAMLGTDQHATACHSTGVSSCAAASVSVPPFCLASQIKSRQGPLAWPGLGQAQTCGHLGMATHTPLP